MNRKQGFLLFLSSCIPGCGQMYQGYMKRGVSLLIACFGLMTISIFLDEGFLFMLLPIIWLYAFYDSYNLRNQTDEQAQANPDAFLFGLSEMDSQRLSALCRKRHSILGWILVLLGVYLFLVSTVRNITDLLGLEELYWALSYELPRLLVTIFLIALGIWFIRGPKKPQEPEDSIPAFTPPEEESHEEE